METDGRPRRRRLGDQRREDVEHRHPQGAVRPDLRPHRRQARRRRRHHRVPRRRPTRPGSRSRSSCGRSTCRPTTPTSRSPTCGCRTRRSSAARAAGSASSSTSSTRTASARRRRSLGAAQFCINESVEYAKERKPFGKALATNQAHPVPARRAADAVRDAAGADPQDGVADGHRRRVLRSPTRCRCATTGPTGCAARRPTGRCRCTAGSGYSRHKPFEHIYRHHRRYRITEGAEEIQMRRVAGYMFGYMNQQAPKGVDIVHGTATADADADACSSCPRRPSCWRRSPSCSTTRCSRRCRRDLQHQVRVAAHLAALSSARRASARPAPAPRARAARRAARRRGRRPGGGARRAPATASTTRRSRRAAWPALVEIARARPGRSPSPVTTAGRASDGDRRRGRRAGHVPRRGVGRGRRGRATSSPSTAGARRHNVLFDGDGRRRAHHRSWRRSSRPARR